MTTSGIKRPAYNVLLAPPDTDPATVSDDDALELHVVIHAADQLTAERELMKLGMKGGGRDQPMHVTALWVWAALVRAGEVTYKWPEFKQRLLAFDEDKARPAPLTPGDDDPELDEYDAHPTVASTP